MLVLVNEKTLWTNNDGITISTEKSFLDIDWEVVYQGYKINK
jgi:hypothetical protein